MRLQDPPADPENQSLGGGVGGQVSLLQTGGEVGVVCVCIWGFLSGPLTM